jgi:hypothetical protein
MNRIASEPDPTDRLTDFLPVILSPVSLTEFPAYWCEHPELFASISEGQTEQERVERVLRWFIGTLKAQYTVSRRGRRIRLGLAGGERDAETL